MSRHDWTALNRAVAWITGSKYADLPTMQVMPVPLPEGHPDLDTFDADMDELNMMASRCLIRAQDGGQPADDNVTADIYEDMLEELRPFASSPRLHLAIDMATFDCILDDIDAWKRAA